MLNKKITLLFIAIIIAIIITSSLSLEPAQTDDAVFHITLADSDLYVNGVYTKALVLERGEYFFRFVPNGSSPEILSITLNGDTFDFSEDFELIGVLYQTAISEYFTWEYDGQKNITIPETQELVIIINPNNETSGSVSVDILAN